MRPGTYDINSKSYKENFDKYINLSNDKHEEIDPNQQWTLFYIEIDLKTLQDIINTYDYIKNLIF